MIPLLQLALDRRGYTSLTPVQEAVSDPALADADLLVSAQTGSGKTVGFGLAIAPTLLPDGEAFGQAAAPLALVIAPTRELALQVKRELSWLYGEAGAILASCVGGMDMRDERRALERGAHIVVATPGRLRDHIMRGSIDLSAISAVVLDEADEMLDLGFREDLEFILEETPQERRTLLFSATVSGPIARLAETYQREAQRISTIDSKSQHSDITYFAHEVAQHDVEHAIINVLRFHEAPNAIVFANTRAAVSRLVTRLSNRGFQVVALSGELSQAERAGALQAMRDGRARVCVATDVAARGIDLPSLDLVVHADLPSSHETLLHRSGRTGRAGRKGSSALIVPPRSRRKAERLLREAKLSAEWTDAPSADTVRDRDLERLMQDPAWQEPLPESLEEARASLTERFSAEDLAAAYLRLWSAARSAPEELAPAPAQTERKPREPREPFGPSVWFSIPGGRDAGADPRRLLPMLCKGGGIDKSAIGAIRVMDQVSYAEILEDRVDGFLSTLGDTRALDDGSVLERLEQAPDLPPRSKPPFGKGPRDGRKGPGGPRKPHRGQHDDRPARTEGERPEFSPRPLRGPAERGDRADRGEKPRWKKSDAPRGDAPYGKPAGKPAGKPGAKPFGKPAGKPAGKPTGKPGGKFSKDKPFGGDRPKGPPPPKGKPNSKKNKARRTDGSPKPFSPKGGR